MVGPDGAVGLPWLAGPLQHALRTQRGHALLLHGPQGVGQFEMGLTLAQAWLCEGADAERAAPCGSCAACRLMQAHSHPDLLVLLPEVLREPLGWAAPPGDADGAADKAGKAKPSKEIKVDSVRLAVAFAQITSARGRLKVVVLHPAERMNHVAANTLLKTLEEPAGNARFILCSATPDALLPTVRSRCQAVPMALPAQDVAAAWLAGQGVAEPGLLLAAAGGQPLEALDWHRQGVDAAAWTRLPERVRRGDPSAVSAWPLALLVDALQKICHDAACLAAGAGPRYFPPGAVPAGAEARLLNDWNRELQRVARHAEHPWNAGLMAESLFQQGSRALAAGPRRGPQGASVHSRG